MRDLSPSTQNAHGRGHCSQETFAPRRFTLALSLRSQRNLYQCRSRTQGGKNRMGAREMMDSYFGDEESRKLTMVSPHSSHALQILPLNAVARYECSVPLLRTRASQPIRYPVSNHRFKHLLPLRIQCRTSPRCPSSLRTVGPDSQLRTLRWRRRPHAQLWRSNGSLRNSLMGGVGDGPAFPEVESCGVQRGFI